MVPTDMDGEKLIKHLRSIEMETVKMIVTTAAAKYDVEEAQRLTTTIILGEKKTDPIKFKKGFYT